MFVIILIVILYTSTAISAQSREHCLVENLAGCEMGRPPIYMVMAPRRIRPEQIYQVFGTILRMEFGQEAIYLGVSIVRDDREYSSKVVRFDRPSSRILQLQMPSNAEYGSYRLRVEGKLSEGVSGNIFMNETDIEFFPKRASLFIQMSKPIYKQEQMVHFRVIPIQPDMMPKYGNLIIYIEDPTGFAVKRWQGLQSNAGGIISQQFQLSDQPNYGTWNIRVDAFGYVYRRPFKVEEFWMPRFDVNVTVPDYVMDNATSIVRGSVLANHTSGRPCVGNASITVFFIPREEIWNSTQGWEKPHRDALKSGNSWSKPMNGSDYKSIKDIFVKDYHLYFAYEYRFVQYYNGRFDFEWTRDELMQVATRGGEARTLEGSEFMFFANVTDWYSGLNRTGWAGTIMYSNKIKMSWIGGNVRIFKPGSIFKVQVAVSQYDGTPVDRGGSVTITPTIVYSDATDNSPSNSMLSSPVMAGIAEFEFELGIYTQRFSLTAVYQNPSEVKAHTALLNPNFVTSSTESIMMLGNKYFSPTNSYISVTTSTYHPYVNEFMIFHVTVSHFVPRIFYQIISQSNIIDGDELEMTSRQKTFAIGLSRLMLPMARIIVYYIREPEEIVSDVLTFFVNGTHQNQVKLGINQGKDFSRNTIEFNAEADPGSYVAFSAMLLDQYNWGLSDGITENKLIDELMTYDAPANQSYKQLWRVGKTEYEYKFFHGNDYGIDGNTTFLSAGLLILTDADVTRLPNQLSCDPKADQYPCFTGTESECFSSSQRCNGKFDGCPNDGADEWGCEEEDRQTDHKSLIDRVSRVMRYYDNSTWAWQEIFVKPDGRVDFRVDVPKYPLTWVINGVSISRDLGLGIMQQPVKYSATRFMYIQVEHPEIIAWGEQVGIRITVFNYWYDDDYIEVLITMHADSNMQFVLVGDMGYVTSYAPKTHKGDHQILVFLEPGESKDIYMPIVADKDFYGDELSFRVSATCFLENDEYIGSMILKPPGVVNYFHTPFLIDLIRYPSIDIPQFKVNVLEDFRKQQVRENLYVPWSSVAMNTLYGDVVGPGFFENYLNAENVLYRPYGSGEMVTFNFAYNLLLLKFLRSSKQLHDYAQVKVVLKELNIVLQRIFSYMNWEDGSFRMFRDDTESNLWLTAFVGKTLAQFGLIGDWEQDLYIPQDMVTRIVEFICSKQNTSTGAFEPDNLETAYDRKMSSLKEMKSQPMSTHRIPLTAYIVIALTEMTEFVKGTVQCIENAKASAAYFLQTQISSFGEDDIFFMAITAYALSLTTTQNDLVTRLWKLKRNDSEYTYFADQKVYENPSAIQNNVRYLMPRQELLNDAYAVQTTAYALMAHINANQGSKNERDMTVNWLSTMRNSFAGFSSTQDTIVAMEALYTFALNDTNRNEFDVSVSLDATSTPNWHFTQNLQQSDFTSLKVAKLPYNGVFGYIIPTAQGVGRAMLQLTVTSNVEYDKFMKTQQHYNNNPDEALIPFFSLNPSLKFSGRNDSIMLMETCVSWLYTQRSLTSGLAVLEVETPTGYIVMNDTLREYVRSGVVKTLKRAEFYRSKVVFYFEYLDESKTCVDFRADRWYPVANTSRAHRIRVYDYYEPGMHQTSRYTVENLFLMSICFACGSYQCPYCPYFNSSTLLRAGISNFLLVAVVLLIIKLLLQDWGQTSQPYHARSNNG